MVQREAAFLIARATEEFVHRIAEAAQRAAARERRTTVQAKDLGACSATLRCPRQVYTDISSFAAALLPHVTT